MPVILIIGGGIAGTAAALALDKAAIDATVYEAHPVSSHDRGAFLTLASNGMHALRQIDADTIVRAVSAPLRTMRVCTDQGHEIATVALSDTHDPATGYRYLTRAALCSALQREAQDRGIRIERGKRLTQATAHRCGVTNAYDIPQLRTWHRDHMLLIGDAAHAASPATGQGASMALEDAVILAKSLRDRPDPASAFVTYEQLRRDRVQANITRSARMSAQSRLDWPQLPLANQQAPAPNEAIDTQFQWHTPLV